MRLQTKHVVLLSLLIISQLLLPSSVTSQTASSIRIGFDLGHGNLHLSASDLASFTNYLQGNGVQVTYSIGALNQTFLNSITLLIVSSPQIAFTPEEISSLTSWSASKGGVWLSASYEDPASASILNTLLQGVHSELRFEYGYASDSLYNLNSTPADANQVIIPIINHQAGLAARLTANLRTLYSYRPVPIITYNGTGYSSFNATRAANATWIAQTSSTARILNSTATPLLVYSTGTYASTPIVGVESVSGTKLALTGFPLFSQSNQSFTYFQRHPYDNKILAGNLVGWLTGLSLKGELEASMPEVRGTTQPLVLIYTGSASEHVTSDELQPLQSLLSGMGLNVQTFQFLSYDAIKNASAVIIQSPGQLIGSNDTDAMQQWLAQGNKLLILASSADYELVGSAIQSVSLNGVLSAIGANLRFEAGSVIDPEVNIGGNPYSTLASNINHDSPIAANLTSNVRSISMQFPTILAGSNQTTLLPLENQTYLNSLTNVTWLAKTSNQSKVFDLDSRFPLQAHKENQQGSYIVAAQERYRPDIYGDTLLLVGGPIFSDFAQQFQYPTAYGYPLDNIVFLRNIFTPLLKQTQTRTEIDARAFPPQLLEGGNITMSVNYNSLQTSISNLSEVDRVPITNANLTLSLSGTTLHTIILPNGTYTAPATPSSTGSISWTVAAAAQNFQSQTASGSVQVNPLPTRFTIYVISIPIVVFIAVTVAVVVRKAR